MNHRFVPPCSVVALAGALALLALGCDDEPTTNGPTAGAGGTGNTSQGGGGSGGQGGVGAAGGSGGTEYVPTPADIGFTPNSPIPSGEQILYNDWAIPDSLMSMAPDGSNAIEIFSVFRVWSMGAARGGDMLAFSAGDPNQEEHYGLTLGDAIQHSWLYDFATETISLVAYGNINDECHHFGPGDDTVFVCRRYDFHFEDPYWLNDGYRIARIDLTDHSSTFITEDVEQQLHLHPQVTPDGSELWFTLIQISGTSQHRSIMKMTLPSGTPTLVRDLASAVHLSPDGTRYLYADTAQQSVVYASDLDGQNEVLVANTAGTRAIFSPDGSQVVYLQRDSGNNCQHIDVVAADGSQADAATRLRDCAQSGEFITQLAWIVAP